MDDVERGDDVVLLGNALRNIMLGKAHAVRDTGCPGILRGALDGGTEDVIADVPRPRKRLGQLDDRPSAPAAYVGDPGTALQLCLHVGHGGDPLLDEKVLEPAVGEPVQPIPHVGRVGRLGNSTP